METSENQVTRALISVSDKTGLVEFARRLVALDIQILSTGGTARALRGADLPVTDVSEYTGFPEVLDGRVKTLHPRIHGGLLGLRNNPRHLRLMEEHGIGPIDLLVVNLYPFRETVSRPGVTREEAIEQIDIGGPSMLRSAAKNHRWVTVICQPSRYAEVAQELEERRGTTSPRLRRRLALEAFTHTADYDRAIAAYLARGEASSGADSVESAPLTDPLELSLPLSLRLRYGENPHQAAAYYGDMRPYLEKLHGKDLSYNNIVDVAAALELVQEFSGEALAAVAIIKHTNPCGIALARSVPEAWERALATDRDAANGGIVAMNRRLEITDAEALHDFFTEIIAAPDFAPDALEKLRARKNRILLRTGRPISEEGNLRIRSAPGGVLAQEPDVRWADPSDFRVVTRRHPTEEELANLLLAWKIVKHVKSNAILFTRDRRSLGVGAGQMSRVDSARVAILKARRAGLSLVGSGVASDAFFPFPDGLLVCAEAGATAFIQPGGSRRDEEVIAAADDIDAAMLFTGERHFRH